MINEKRRLSDSHGTQWRVQHLRVSHPEAYVPACPQHCTSRSDQSMGPSPLIAGVSMFFKKIWCAHTRLLSVPCMLLSLMDIVDRVLDTILLGAASGHSKGALPSARVFLGSVQPERQINTTMAQLVTASDIFYVQIDWHEGEKSRCCSDIWCLNVFFNSLSMW